MATPILLSTLAIFHLSARSHAQASTINLFLPTQFASPLPTLQASIVAADASTTTYYMACAGQSQFNNVVGKLLDPCDLIGGLSVIVEPTAVILTGVKEAHGESAASTVTESCGFTSDLATCTGVVSVTHTSNGRIGQTASAIGIIGVSSSSYVYPVTVTAGLEKAVVPTSSAAVSSSSHAAAVVPTSSPAISSSSHAAAVVPTSSPAVSSSSHAAAAAPQRTMPAALIGAAAAAAVVGGAVIF